MIGRTELENPLMISSGFKRKIQMPFASSRHYKVKCGFTVKRAKPRELRLKFCSFWEKVLEFSKLWKLSNSKTIWMKKNSRKFELAEKTLLNIVVIKYLLNISMISNQWRTQGGEGGRTPPPRNRKNCCRNLVLSSRGPYFRSGVRNPRNI